MASWATIRWKGIIPPDFDDATATQYHTIYLLYSMRRFDRWWGSSLKKIHSSLHRYVHAVSHAIGWAGRMWGIFGQYTLPRVIYSRYILHVIFMPAAELAYLWLSRFILLKMTAMLSQRIENIFASRASLFTQYMSPTAKERAYSSVKNLFSFTWKRKWLFLTMYEKSDYTTVRNYQLHRSSIPSRFRYYFRVNLYQASSNWFYTFSCNFTRFYYVL